MFAKLFAPKWRHRDPRVRRTALEALPPGAAESLGIFTLVAQEDDDAAIRGLAIRRLQDLDLLRQLSNDGREAEDRACAEQHLAQLLCCAADQGPNLPARRELLTKMAEARWFERVLQGAAEAELRRFALAHVERQSVLGDVALGDAEPSLRLEALVKITQRSTLERVAKGARRRDKEVHARARETLDAWEAAERRPQELREQAEKLCTQIEALVKAARHNTNWEAMEAAAAQAAQQWGELVPELDTEAAAFAARFQPAQARVEQDLATWRQQQAAEREARAGEAQHLAAADAVCAALESALAQIRDAGSVADRSAIENLLAEREREWNALGGLPAGLNARHRAAVAALRDTLADAAVLQEALPRLEAIHEAVQRSLAREAPREAELKRLEQEWSGVPRPRQLQLDAVRVAQVEAGLAALRSRLEQERERQRAQADKLSALVAQLEDYLAKDTYKPAFELAQQVQQTLDDLPEAARHALLKKSLLRRWQQVQAQLQEMRDWRQWANAPVMERLCDDMERLADQAGQHAGDDMFDFTDCAARVRAAREEWKQLTSARSGAPKSLWRRFDAACSRAYAPCEARFGAEHQQREAHLAAKQAICAGLESYAERLASQPIDLVDWPALEQIIQTADAEWKASGPVPHAAHTASNKRFRKVMERLRAQVHERYERNREGKEELIRRAAGLLQSVQDARLAVTDAVEKTKALQAEWKAIGRAAKDGELWRRFRAECDAVFALRDAEKTAHAAALAADVAVYEALCAQIEEAITKISEEPGRARQHVEAAQAQWRTAPRLPKREVEKVDRRFRLALERFDKQVREERQHAQQRERQRVLDRAALCAQLERLAENAVNGALAREAIDAALAPLSAQWIALGEGGGAAAKALEQRYAQATAWFSRLQEVSLPTEEFAAVQQAASAKRHALCLDMEILVGVESPPEYREARLKYQVEHLAKHMKSGERHDANARAAEIEAAWYATAALPSASAEGLERRFAGAMKRLGMGGH